MEERAKMYTKMYVEKCSLCEKNKLVSAIELTNPLSKRVYFILAYQALGPCFRPLSVLCNSQT